MALAYGARDEMARASAATAAAIRAGDLETSDADAAVGAALGPPVDLLLRTSGEVRLSDFLLRESAFAHVEFVDCMWPELTVWHLIGAVFRFQRDRGAREAARRGLEGELAQGGLGLEGAAERVDRFRRSVEDARSREVDALASSSAAKRRRVAK